MPLIFNEETMINNTIFKYEQRLVNRVNNYIEAGALLTTYYNLRENSTTVDRGLQDIEQLFGSHSPLRYNRIENFPLYGFDTATPNNTDENNIEDINVEGDSQILPATIVPHPNDIFIVNHLHMTALFQVVEVSYDSMKPVGYYKIRYRLQSTSTERLEWLEKQVVGRYRCIMESIGTDTNPIIQVDDAVKLKQVRAMVVRIIGDYRSMFYDQRHNCFLYSDGRDNRYFDNCLNEFIATNSLMNCEDTGGDVLVLHHKLIEPSMGRYYGMSVYRWVEDNSPIGLLRSFRYMQLPCTVYPDSSFNRWSDHDIRIILPTGEESDSPIRVFNQDQLSFLRTVGSDTDNQYDQLLKLYCHGNLTSISQVPLTLCNSLSVLDDFTNYTMVPIMVYIIRLLMRFS